MYYSYQYWLSLFVLYLVIFVFAFPKLDGFRTGGHLNEQSVFLIIPVSRNYVHHLANLCVAFSHMNGSISIAQGADLMELLAAQVTSLSKQHTILQLARGNGIQAGY